MSDIVETRAFGILSDSDNESVTIVGLADAPENVSETVDGSGEPSLSEIASSSGETPDSAHAKSTSLSDFHWLAMWKAG